MDHLSEILKIIDGALQHNVRKAADYAGLLADKLDEGGNTKQALMIRKRLARVPRQTLAPTSVENALPIDSESQLTTLDEELPRLDGTHVLLPDATQMRLEEFIGSVEAAEKLAAAGVNHPPRLLLFGPPGCGKTETARYIAARLQLPLLTARCDTLVSSLLGQTSRNLRRVFDHAENRPCILFLDEFDALAKTRADDREVGELQRVVIALLQNIDAMSQDTILIAATNHDELLDRAVWRRFSWHAKLSLPDAPLRSRIWESKLGTFAPSDLKTEALAELSEALSGAAIEHVAHDAIRNAVIRGDDRIDAIDLLRRLGLVVAMTQGLNLDTREKEIEFLRHWGDKPIALRKLADYYGISVRQTENAARGRKHGRQSGEPDSPGETAQNRQNATHL